mgnify:CR=1 FL=1|jgi:hypothetical protein
MCTLLMNISKMAFSLYSRAFECLSEDKYDDSEADINLRLGEAYYRVLIISICKVFLLDRLLFIMKSELT